LVAITIMSSLRKPFQNSLSAALLLAISVALAGCGLLAGDTTPTNLPPVTGKTSDILNVGDLVTVVFSDTPTPTTPFEERVKDDGTITLLLNQTFKVIGKTRSELEKEIRTRYVPAYYVNLTVTVKPQERFYYVGGEVKQPSRQPYPGEITVLKAIQSCGDFTDFANKRKVRLTRGSGQTLIIDCVAALEKPQLDLPVYPGDKITIPRSIW
jgi:protein involved in polysaccharide export with SLBB domain